MSFDKINKLVNSIAKFAEDSEKLSIPVMAVKLHKLAEAHPYDQTIVSMFNVVGKMDENKKLFMSRAELKDLYSKCYSRNTKFAQHFANELGDLPQMPSAKVVENKPVAMNSIYEGVKDSVLANALSSAFDNKAPKLYTSSVAGQAKNVVASHLEMWSLKPSQLDVTAGNENFIVVKASYNTPKGTTSILVPVEVVADKALEPNVFMCNAGPQDINHVNVKNYLTKSAGVKLKVRSEDVLNILTKQASPETPLSTVEMAAIKIAATKGKAAGFGGVMGQKVDEVGTEVQLPKLAEAETFAEKFSTPGGVAGFKFGSDKINLGRELIGRKLAGFAMKNPQITVVATDDTTIFYGVSLFNGKVSFKVPVKIASGKVLTPDFLICNGSLAALNKESISDLLVSGNTDAKVAAASSPQHGLSPAQLIENVRAAVEEGNLIKAEDGLNVLQQSGNTSAYKEAFAFYMQGMSGTKKTASAKSGCSMIIKNAHSSHALCGHTGLPLHKVYQDEHGNCHPNYRKGMDGLYEGAFFMNSKIFG